MEQTGLSCYQFTRQQTILSIFFEEKHFEMITLTATYPSRQGWNDLLLQGKHTIVGTLRIGRTQTQGCEFSSLCFPVVVLLFLFIYGEIKSVMWKSNTNLKCFS